MRRCSFAVVVLVLQIVANASASVVISVTNYTGYTEATGAGYVGHTSHSSGELSSTSGLNSAALNAGATDVSMNSEGAMFGSGAPGSSFFSTYWQFTVNEDVEYEILAMFDSTSGSSFWTTQLIDLSTTPLTEIWNFTTPLNGVESGSHAPLVGTLFSGRTYQFYFGGLSTGDPSLANNTNAAGSASLVLNPAAVPEPNSVVLWGIISVTGWAASKYQKRKLDSNRSKALTERNQLA